jgi:hypothetical protein
LKWFVKVTSLPNAVSVVIIGSDRGAWIAPRSPFKPAVRCQYAANSIDTMDTIDTIDGLAADAASAALGCGEDRAYN